MVWHPGHQPGSLPFLLLGYFVRRRNAPWTVLSLQLLVPRSQFHAINYPNPQPLPSPFLPCRFVVLLLFQPCPFPPSLPSMLHLTEEQPSCISDPAGLQAQGVGQRFTLKHLCGASKLYWERKLLPPPAATWPNSAASETSPGCFSHQILPHKKKVTEV